MAGACTTYVGYSTFHRRKKGAPQVHICLVGDRTFQRLFAPASVGPIAQRAGGHVWGTKAKPLAPPTALLSEAPSAKIDAPHCNRDGRCPIKLSQFSVLVSLFWPVTAFAAAGDTFFTADMLHRHCNQSSESCTSYIAGVVDTLIAAGAAQKVPRICLHERTDLGQAVDVISNYLRAHPEKRHLNAASIATIALKQSFPCSSHRRPPH